MGREGPVMGRGPWGGRHEAGEHGAGGLGAHTEGNMLNGPCSYFRCFHPFCSSFDLIDERETR